MKNRFFTLTALALFAATMMCSSCNEKIVPANQFPNFVTAFVAEYFPGASISYVTKDPDLFKTVYEVRLNDGTEIEFNKGEWDSVDCKRQSVPVALVPNTIAEYVKGNFPGVSIVKIDKEYYGYEVELSNDLDLKFDRSGNLKRVDD